MITVSSPGKLMLMGEHAVVYGHQCIVTAVDERLWVTIEKAENLQFEIPQATDNRFLQAAVAIAQKHFDLPVLNAKISTHNGFSSVTGFGSSSAVTVAAIKAIAAFTGHALDPKTLFEYAYEAVLSVQGVGSGFDVAAATYGGTMLYTKGGVVLDPLVMPQPLPLVIGYTGVKADTTTIVKEIGKKRAEYPEKVNRIFEAIEKLVRDAVPKLREGDYERVGTLMDFNQEYLRDLGVSSQPLESLITAAKHAGAWGAKLSGAGGGDCMIALVSTEHRNRVEQAIEKAGGQVISTAIHAPGVRIETTDDLQELFVVVNEKDEIIGPKTRQDCHRDASLIHRSVNIVLHDDLGRILLQQRSQTKDLEPGYWTLSATGHVGWGEEYTQAAQRELAEELGLHAALDYERKFLFQYPQETEMTTVYTALYTAGDITPDTKEVAAIHWFDQQSLHQAIEKKEIVLTKIAAHVLQEKGWNI